MKSYINAGLALMAFMLFLYACNSNAENKKPTSVTYEETTLKDFLQSSPQIAQAVAISQLDTILNNAAKDSSVFRKTVDFLENPFSDPNSSLRDDGLYAEILQAKMKSPWCDSLEKAVIRKRLYLLMQNQPGTQANDFTYITPEGQIKKLYDIKADYMLLMFYNPECPACKDMKTALIASSIIKEEISSGKLRLLAIYTDANENVWRKHLSEMPKDWIEGRDENEYLYNNSVYDLKAIPTLYLLDRNKKVLLKDCLNVSKIENAISGNVALR